MDIGEIIVQGIVDGVGRDQIVITRRVIAALEPAYRAVERIEDGLLHLGLGIHLLQGRIGNPLQYRSRKLFIRLLDRKKDMRVVE